MKDKILEWLKDIEKQEGVPPEEVIAFNFGLLESDQGYVMYLVGGFEYSAEDDSWASIEPPTKSHRYLVLSSNLQFNGWDAILDMAASALRELEAEGSLHKSLVGKAQALTTGFDDGDLVKIR